MGYPKTGKPACTMVCIFGTAKQDWVLINLSVLEATTPWEVRFLGMKYLVFRGRWEGCCELC